MTCMHCDGHRCRACINPLQRHRVSKKIMLAYLATWSGLAYIIYYLLVH
jgi:hypothetical protein